MQNKAQFGGVMDLEHVIGTVIIAYSNLTENLAENSKKYLKIILNSLKFIF